MFSAPLSERLTVGARALMIALGERRRGLPLWVVTYLHGAIERLRRSAVDLLRKLEVGTYHARKPGVARRACVPPRAPRPAPAVRFPGFLGIVNELIGNERGATKHGLHELLQDLALPAYVETCPALARRLRPLCRLVGVEIPAWLRAPKRPGRPRATPAPGAPAKRLSPDPTEPNWRLLRNFCRANHIARSWGGGGPPPHVLVHCVRHLLSREVIDVLR